MIALHGMVALADRRVGKRLLTAIYRPCLDRWYELREIHWHSRLIALCNLLLPGQRDHTIRGALASGPCHFPPISSYPPPSTELFYTFRSSRSRGGGARQILLVG